MRFRKREGEVSVDLMMTEEDIMADLDPGWLIWRGDPGQEQGEPTPIVARWVTAPTFDLVELRERRGA